MDSSSEPLDTITAAAAGDMAAFERLYRQYSPRIYGLCLRLTGQREAAEDCTQESFVAAWRALSRFERRSRFSTWLHKIAVNCVLSRRKGLRMEYEVARARDRIARSRRPRQRRTAARCGACHRGTARWGSSCARAGRHLWIQPRRGSGRAGDCGRYLQGSAAPCTPVAYLNIGFGGNMNDRQQEDA